MKNNESDISNDVSTYFDFIRYVVNPINQSIPDVEGMDWFRFLQFAYQQAIVGVCFEGISRLSEQGVRLPFEVLMEWIATSGQIEGLNKVLNKKCVEVVNEYQKVGFDCCVLKGQGNAMMYPNPFSRMSGDIDLWVMLRSDGRSKKSEVRNIIKYVRKRNPGAKACYHHVDAGTYNGVEVEVHYRPSFMNNLIHNKRMQRWYDETAEEQFAHDVELPDGVGHISVPTHGFNRIYQMAHISHHVIHEGIGLRQLIDYYFLLRQGFTEEERKRDVVLLKNFGLYKVATAVMWVLSEVLGLEERYLIAPKDEHLGNFLLSEILHGGNFGKHNEENIKANNRIKKNWLRIKRDFRLMRYFPSECIWEPIFRLYHFFWRMING